MQPDFLELVEAISATLTAKGMTLALAESCTGGQIANALTDLPGASGYFVLGVVSYSAASKVAVLGVSPGDLERFGTVSAETASAMASGVRRLGNASLGLATTGVAGPAAVEGRDTGLVYLAAAYGDRLESRTLRLTGSRLEIKRQASLEALRFLKGLAESWG